MDIGGHPPIPLRAPPLSLSVFKFRHHLLFLAVFQVLNFRSHFEALNDVFGKIGRNMALWTDVAHIESCTPQIYISNELLSVSNKDRIPKLRPWEVETPIYPNGTHNFGASSPRVRFLDVSVFPLFLNNK